MAAAATTSATAAAATAKATATATTMCLSSWGLGTNVPVSAVKFLSRFHVPTISLKLPPHRVPFLLRTQKRFLFRPPSAATDTAVEENQLVDSADMRPDEDVNRTKLYVVNLPWDYSVSDLENLFGQFGTVNEVEIIKQKNGKSRGFAFVAMSSVEEAQVAIEKMDSFELLGRIIRVELAKSFKKPYSGPAPPSDPNGETRNCIYVSNLAWKVRSANLREFFAAKFKPVSALVVFDKPSGKSAGYGFVSFATDEEAFAAISELDGKELIGRPVRLKISQKKSDEPEIISEYSTKGQP